MRSGISSAIKKELFARARGRCEICGRKSDAFETSHILPLTAGGTDAIVNLRMVCPSCNHRIHGTAHENIQAIKHSASEAYRFERAVANAFGQLGYAVLSEVTGPDGGVDLIARRQYPDSNQRVSIVVECRYASKPVSAAQIRTFASKFEQYRGDLGLIVTNRGVSSQAMRLAMRLGIRITTLDKLDEILSALSGFNNG